MPALQEAVPGEGRHDRQSQVHVRGVSVSARKSTGKKLRFEVFKRDGFICQYCGAHPPTVILVVDHIAPVADGGQTVIDNLVTACEPCNQGKGARPLISIPESLSSKAERVAEAEEQIRGYQQIMRSRADRIESETWEVAEILWPGCGVRGAKSADLTSIKRFVEKLGVIECLAMADSAVARGFYANRMFRYFCGGCWARMRELGE